MKKWDGIEPRAVVATKDMMNAENITEASFQVALTSPYNIGLGISILQSETGEVSDEAATKPLPSYYVSPANVRKRRHDTNVKAGWYVVVEPGQLFKVIVSPLNGSDSVKWTAGPDGDVVVVHLEVDGKFADNWMFRQNELSEVHFAGFREYPSENNPCEDSSSINVAALLKLSQN